MSQGAPTSCAEGVPAKRLQILMGARQVFAELGFLRASVDVIAARAGVSKATIYNHFEDKTALFVACVAYDADVLHASLGACAGEAAGDVEPALQRIGEDMMRVFLSPDVVAFYRQTIPEAANIPHLGQMIFDRGFSVIHAALAAHLERWHRSGALRIDDARAAAVQFVALCQADLVSRARLAILTYPVDDLVRETVQRAVRTFVRAYRP